MRVIGTAGHIDHGKSALVRRLTGIDPDRLSEEKRRGMTIDLGFAWLTMPSGIEASIVDVPGHERFIKNMLAGAAGIDVALLVVAADELVMPQTQEHLEILDLLEVRQGVVALTKADLVDEEWLEFGREEVRGALAGTSLESSEVVPVSVVTNRGIGELLAALDRALASGAAPRNRGRPYLPIDRVFTVTGFGTVVTGTLHDGRLTRETAVELMPASRQTRVRSLQTHQHDVEAAEPGSRVAVNLAGLGKDEAERGDVLASRGVVSAVKSMDVGLRVLDSAPFPLRHGLQVTVHIGAAERVATVSVLDAGELAPGASGWVQLRFEGPVAAVKDQKLVIRLPAPARTVAGGSVADLAPRHRRSDPAAIRRLEQLSSGRPETMMLAALDGKRPRDFIDLARITGMEDGEVGRTLDSLVAAGRAVRLGNHFVSGARWDDLRTRALNALAAYHADNPLRPGMGSEELRTRVSWRYGEWPAVLHALADSRAFRLEGALVALATHAGGVGARRAQADAVLAALRREPFSPPAVADLLRETGADAALLAALVTEGTIVRMSPDVYLERAAHDELVCRILLLIREGGPITVAQVRDRLGTSRKYALAFLEHLDDERITRRVGDTRVAGKAAPACA